MSALAMEHERMAIEATAQKKLRSAHSSWVAAALEWEVFAEGSGLWSRDNHLARAAFCWKCAGACCTRVAKELTDKSNI